MLAKVQRGVQNVSLQEGRQERVGVDTTVAIVAFFALGSVDRTEKWVCDVIFECRRGRHYFEAARWV